METDAADGNPLRTRIPTAAWKAQNAFHSSHKARRRLHHRIHFSLGRGMGSTSNIKQQVCQFQTVSTEGFTPNDSVEFVPIPRRAKNNAPVPSHRNSHY